jgi:hypothetical protein
MSTLKIIRDDWTLREMNMDWWNDVVEVLREGYQFDPCFTWIMPKEKQRVHVAGELSNLLSYSLSKIFLHILNYIFSQKSRSKGKSMGYAR